MASLLAPLQRVDPTGLSDLLPGNYFLLYTVTTGFPSENTAAYRLTVDGLVERSLNLSVADLQAMPPTRLVRDFQCVTGWRVFDVKWTGVRLSDILDRAGVKTTAHALRFTSFDGEYTESLTLDQARRPDVIVAYGMEGGDVQLIHGGPVRMYVAPMYGYKSTKWLDTIELTAQVEPGYWEHNGYDVDGWVGRSNGRSDTPT